MLIDIEQVVEAFPEASLLLDAQGAVLYRNQASQKVLGDAWSLFEGEASLPLSTLVAQSGAQPLGLERCLGLEVAGQWRGVLVRLSRVGEASLLRLSELAPPELGAELAFDSNDDCRCLVTETGAVLHVNAGASRTLGWARDALLASGLLSNVHPDDLPRTRQALRSALPIDGFVNRVQRRDGEWRLLSWSIRHSSRLGELRTIHGVDVTESLRREEELVTSRELLAEAQDIANLCTLVYDFRTGQLDAAPRLRSLLGVPEGEGIETFIEQRLDAPSRRLLAEALERGLRGEASALRLTLELPKGTREFKVWSRPHRDLLRHVVRLVGVVQDVTDEARFTAQLRLAERMATVGTLAAGVAHEINNPLSFIIANLGAVESELSHVKELPGVDLTEIRAALTDATDGASRVRDVVAGLRAFAHADENRSAPCDLVAILEAVLNLTRNETRHRARVISRFEPLPAIVANEARLGQVFLNLVLNAAQAIPDGHMEQHSITLSTRRTANSVVVEVSDTGRGIAPEHRPRIFDPFFTTRADVGGAGLGLFIAQGIVRELNGELKVESELGQGSTFSVVLPIERPQPARARVLVVDDEPLVARSLERMLREHSVTTASSGEEALQLLEGHEFDVVLCDMNMPGLGGPGLWSKLPPALREKTVFVTGGATTDAAQDFLAEHSTSVLFKPFQAEVVQSLVRGQLAKGPLGLV